MVKINNRALINNNLINTIYILLMLMLTLIPTDRQTDRQTDRVTYRDTPCLKSEKGSFGDSTL